MNTYIFTAINKLDGSMIFCFYDAKTTLKAFKKFKEEYPSDQWQITSWKKTDLFPNEVSF